MSNTRVIVRLVFAILVCIAAHVFLYYRGDSTAKTLLRPALAPNADRATEMTFASVGGGTVKFLREGDWRIVSPFEAPADHGAVMRILDALAYAPMTDGLSERELLRLGRTRTDFGLRPPRRTIVVDGREIGFGDTTPAGDGIYAVISGEGVVYTVSTNDFGCLPTAASMLRRRSLMGAENGECEAISIRDGSGFSLKVAKDEGVWKILEPTPSAASATRVKKFLGDIASASVVEFVWPTGRTNETSEASAALLAGYGLDAETAATVVLRPVSGDEERIVFGKESADEFVYALVHGGRAIATVPRKLKDALFAAARTFPDARVFPMTAGEVANVRIAEGDVVYMLSREKSGEWRLDSPVSAPADGESAEALVKSVLALRGEDLSAEGVEVSLATNLAPVRASAISVFGGRRIEDLRSKVIMKAKPGEVRRVVYATGESGKKVTVEFDEDGKAWRIGGEEEVKDGLSVDNAALAKVLSLLEKLEAEAVVKLKVTASEFGAYGLEKPFAILSVDLTGEDSQRKNVIIGEKTAGGRYATLGASDAVFVISEPTVQTLTAVPVLK